MFNIIQKWPPHQYDSTKTVFYSRFNEICINVVAKPNSRLNEITGNIYEK